MPESGVRSVSWVDLSGGVGLYRIRGPQDMNRVYMASGQTHRQSDMTLGPLVVTTGGGGALTGSNHWLGELPTGASNAGEIYAVGSDKKIYKWKSSDDSWGDGTTPGTVLATLTSVPTDVCNATVNGTHYLVFACNNTNTAWSSNGSAWTDNGQNSLYVCAWNGSLWTITSEGQLSYTANMSTFVDDALLPTGTGAVKGMVTGPNAAGEDIIYVLTTKGLYAHDFANAQFWLTSFRDTTGTYYGKLVTWGGNICMPIDDLVWVYPPATGNPYPIGPGLPDGYCTGDDDTGTNNAQAFGPHVLSITPVAGRLYALAGASGADGGQITSFFNGQGWQGVHFGIDQRRRMMASYAYGAHRLWYSTDIASPGSLRYFALPTVTGAYTPYAQTGRFLLPWFDGWDPINNKVALRLHIEVKGASSTSVVTVYFGLDYAVSKMVTLGKVSTDGITTFNFAANTPIGLEFRAIRFVFYPERAAGTNTDTPRIVGVRFEWRPNPMMET